MLGQHLTARAVAAFTTWGNKDHHMGLYELLDTDLGFVVGLGCVGLLLVAFELTIYHVTRGKR